MAIGTQTTPTRPGTATAPRPQTQTQPRPATQPAGDGVTLSPAARTATGPQARPADANTPADLTDQIGTLDYYRNRRDDFVRRNPGVEPPDYYMDYGDKYARRFSEELYPNLSERGQEWLVDARRGLQERMEARRREDPAAFAELERNPEAFRRFAYDTHPDAYMEAGLSRLPPSDLAQIPVTPDRRDLLSPDGLRQVAITGTRVAGEWAQAGANYVADSPVGQAVQDGARYVANSPVGDAARWVADSPVGQAVGDAAQTTGQVVADGARYVANSPVGRAVADTANGAVELGLQGASIAANGIADGVEYVADSRVGRAVGDGARWVADSSAGRAVGGVLQDGWRAFNSLWE